MTAAVIQLHAVPGGASNIPAMLRAAADDIEAGTYGEVTQAVFLCFGEHFNMFSWGQCDAGSAALLLTAAQQVLTGPIVMRCPIR